MSGSGYFYKASLKSLEGKGEWYDLRVTLSDATDNVYTQTLMPAFFLNAESNGIAETTMDNAFDILIRDGSVVVG